VVDVVNGKARRPRLGVDKGMMTRRMLLLAAVAMAMPAGCATVPSGTPAGRALGWQVPLGKGTATSYAEVDSVGAPTAIGVVFSQAALDGLPLGSQDYHCFARNPDGTLGAASKCQHTFEHAIPLPDVLARRADVPFKWVLLNWNPVGHIPPGVYDVPHFDVHFEMVPIADIFAIEPGACGPEFVRCDQFQTGKKPLPPNYVPADFQDVDAVVPAMGNHLIDLTASEFHNQPFNRSWIYGVYDGKVTFYEEMVTRAYLLSKPNACVPIKSPKGVAVRGFYPTVSCIRHDSATGDYSVSMERFVMRETSGADPILPAR
jgi:hypothetical protein